MNATLLLQAMNIRAPELTGTVRVHRMDKHADEPEPPSDEDRRIRNLVMKIDRDGEKRHSITRNQSREMRHERIIAFINTITRSQSVDTRELSLQLGLHYTTTVNDLIEIRKTCVVQFSEPSHSGVGRLYWGKA